MLRSLWIWNCRILVSCGGVWLLMRLCSWLISCVFLLVLFVVLRVGWWGSILLGICFLCGVSLLV